MEILRFLIPDGQLDAAHGLVPLLRKVSPSHPDIIQENEQSFLLVEGHTREAISLIRTIVRRCLGGKRGETAREKCLAATRTS